MDKLILHVRNVVGPYKCRVPAIFLALLFKLRQWCLHPEIIVDAEQETRDAVVPSHNTSRRRVIFDIEGPRVIEQGSSADSSPATISGASQTSQQDSYNSVHPPTSANGLKGSTGLMPVAQDGSIYPQFNSLDDLGTPGTGNNMSVMNPNTSRAANGTYIPAYDAMDLDSSYYQMLSEMNAFTEGGLTGLDDWATQPTDLLAQMDMMNWQQSSNLNNANGNI